MARPSSKTNSGLQTELHTVSSPGRSRELKSTVKSGGMAKDVTPTGDVLSVKPLKYETETRFALSDWFVTDTTVADRIGPLSASSCTSPGSGERPGTEAASRPPEGGLGAAATISRADASRRIPSLLLGGSTTDAGPSQVPFSTRDPLSESRG